MSITNPMQKIKSWLESEQGRNILVVLIVILVGLGSFELGRLSKSGSSSGIKIQYNGEAESANVLNALKDSKILAKPKVLGASESKPTNSSSATGQNFFASSRGTKYYPVGCTAGNTLKQENRIYFNSREEAEKAGYVLSSSCR